MRRNMAYLFVPTLITPAFLAYFWAQYLIRNHFPDLTLIDLGAFYFLGFIFALATCISLGLSRKMEADK